MEPSRSVGPRRKVTSPFAPLQRSSEPGMQEPRKNVSLRPPTGTIHVILAALERTGSFPSRVLSVARLSAEDRERECKRFKKGSPLILEFSDEDKRRTIQPHDDALVVTLRIGGFDVKRVLVDPSNAVE